MRIGISAYDMEARDLLDLAVAADDLGFDTLWLGEHVFHPVAYASEHPTHGQTAHQHHTGPIVADQTELLDPLVALSGLAAATTRLRLATGIFVLTLRHPLLTARATCTLQEMAEGRFLLGVGSGWLREEFDALGVPFDERRARLEEAIEVLRRAWAGGPFDFHGKVFAFEELQVTPRPTPVPLILGGNSGRALRRAALVGDGWFSSGTPSFDEAAALRDQIMALRDEHGRTEPYRCYVRVDGFDPEAIARYGREGIDDVVVWADKIWPDGPLEAKRAALADAAAALGLTS